MSSTLSTPNSPPYIVDGKTDAERYLEGINDGSIVASKWMRKLSDIMLPRFHEEYHGAHYDVSRALRPVQFIERFTCFPEGPKMGQPFILEQFQRSAIEIVYGFIDEDELRTCRQAFMVIARKNGKTSLLAALCLYHLTSDYPRELGGEVYCCATGESQARKALAAADSMRRHSPALINKIKRGMVQKRGVSGLNYPATDSSMVALSSSIGRLDGLSSSMCCYDEIGAATDNGALLDLIEESTAARRQPLTWLISTNNYVRKNVFDERYDYAKGWLDGTIHDDTFIPILYTLDNKEEIYNEAAWPKANPGLLCGIKDWDYLRNRMNRAEQSPGTLPSVLCKEFNLISSAYSAFLNPSDCINDTTIDFNRIGIPSYVCVGIDLAVKYDLLACIVRWMVPGDNNIYEIAKFWVPSDMINMDTDAKQKDNVPYLLWSTQGQPMPNGSMWHYVDIVDGDRVGMPNVMDFLNDLVNEGIYPYCIGYDPWHVGDLEQLALKRFVGESRTLPVPPTLKAISPLVREHELDLKAHRVICPNPCLHHNRTSVQVREDPQRNVQVQKRDLQPHQRIDGFMAELFSLAAFNNFKEEYISSIGWYPPDKAD